MIYNDAKMKLITLLTALFMGLGLVDPANAETPFYRNLAFGPVGSPSYYSFATSEVADDVPFTGSHLVSSFRVGYRSSIPLLATFRFYGVDPATGLPGQLIAQIERALPASDFGQPTITLDANEQFIFTAAPGLFGEDVSGGWVSMQFASADGSSLISIIAAAQMADGSSKDGLYHVTYDRVITLLDTTGIKPVSFYLEMSSTESDGTTGSVVSKVTDLKLFPSSVLVGASTTATVSLSSQASTGGVMVKFSSDKKGIYFSHPELIVKEGNTTAVNTIFTTKSAGPKGKNKETTADIIAEANGGSARAILTITK